MGHVFLSYARADRAHANRFEAWLTASGISHWFDGRLKPSDPWEPTILDRIDACAALLVLMSPNSAASEAVDSELARAESRQKPIVPVLIAGDPRVLLAEQPFARVKHLQFEDARDFDQVPSPGLIDQLLLYAGTSVGPLGLEPERVLVGHAGAVRGLAYNPHTDVLASVSADGTIRTWGMTDGRPELVIEGHKAIVFSVSFDVDALSPHRPGHRLITGGDDGTVRSWDSSTGQQLARVDAGAPVVSVACSDLFVAAAADSPDLPIYDYWGRPLHPWLHPRLTGHKSWVRAVAFGARGGLLASGGEDKTIRVWEARKGVHLQTLVGHEGSVRTLSFSRTDDALASGSQDGTVRLWNPRTTSHLRTLTHGSEMVRSVAYAPDGVHLASVDEGGTLRVWNTRIGLCRAAVSGLGRLYAVACDGQHITVGSHDGSIHTFKTSEPLTLTKSGPAQAGPQA